MKNKTYTTIERLILVLSAVIAIVGTTKSIILFIQGIIPSNFSDYLFILFSLLGFAIIIYFVARPKSVNYDFLPNLEDIEYQSKLIRSSRHLRFRGVRFKEALTNKQFIESLKFAKEVQLLIMAKFPSPKNVLEEEHNEKHEKIRNLIYDLKKNGINITVRESVGCPEYNELIFDRHIVRRKKYDKNLLSAKNSQVEIYHWEKAKKLIKVIIKKFDADWEEATYL